MACAALGIKNPYNAFRMSCDKPREELMPLRGRPHFDRFCVCMYRNYSVLVGDRAAYAHGTGHGTVPNVRRANEPINCHFRIYESWYPERYISPVCDEVIAQFMGKAGEEPHTRNTGPAAQEPFNAL